MDEDEWEEIFGSIDPETQSDLFEVALDRQMTLEIGLVVRCHVRLDRCLHATLATLTNTNAAPNTPTSTLIDKIKKSLDAKPLATSAATDAAKMALEFARAANQQRNRVLHDNWVAIYNGREGPRLERSSSAILEDLPATPETLRSIESASRALVTSYYRTAGILYYSRVSAGLSAHEIEIECVRALDLMLGDFSGERRAGA